MRIIIYSLTVLVSFALKSQTNTSTFLDKNRVKAVINTKNDKFSDLQNFKSGYEVPKGGGAHSHYANGIWIAGLDSTNNLHMCVNTFYATAGDYFSGPLNTNNISTFTPSVFAKYNRLWKIDCDDIYSFVSNYNSGAIALNTYTPTEAILKYPAIQQGNYMTPMENFNDVFNNGVYGPLSEGDYPLIKGHQQVLSIFNDQGVHGVSNAPPMGLEIHEKSYAFYDPNLHDSMKIVNFTTYYEFTFYNRSNNDYHDVYITNWTDADVGNHRDDYVGTDTVDKFIYCYNANQPDTSTSNSAGYGIKQPVISHAILDCPSCAQDGIDNNHNSLVDEANENFLMDNTMYINLADSFFPPGTYIPTNKKEFYHYMRGYWQDSTQLKYGGTGYNPSSVVNAKWIFTGDPSTGSGWTEISAGNPPGDRGIFMSSGPFFLPKKKKFVYSYAVVFSQDSVNTVNTITQLKTRVRRDVKNARYYANTHQGPQCVPVVIQPFTGVDSYGKQRLRMYPNPAGEKLNIELDHEIMGTLEIRDISARLIMQDKMNSASYITDISQLKPGIYMITIKEDDNTINGKFIRE